MNCTFGHVCFLVADKEKEADFYCNQLGLKRMFEQSFPNTEVSAIYVRIAPGQFLELFYNHNEPAAGTNYNHLCINVESAQEVADYLRPLGLLTVDVKQGRSGTLQCWSADPDGNRVEFMEITPNSQQALADERLGK